MPRPDSLVVTALLTLLVGMGPINTDMYLPSLPAMTRYFAVDVADVQLTLSVFIVGYGTAMLGCGPLSDRFGRRPVLLGGITLYFLATIACALAPTIEALIVARLFQAIGASTAPVLCRAIVRDLYGRERAARVLSYMASAMALAPAIGPILGGLLQEWLGWRSVFVFLAGYGGVMLIGILLLLAETNATRDPAATAPRRMIATYASLLRDPSYLGYLLAASFGYAVIFCFISGSSFVLIDLLGLSPTAYGVCFAAVALGYMVGAYLAGRFVVRLGIERTILTGTIAAAAGGWLMAVVVMVDGESVFGIVAPAVLAIAATGFILPSGMAGAAAPYPRCAGSATALVSCLQMAIAALVGLAIAVGHDGSAQPMAIGTALSGTAAYVFFTVLVWRRRLLAAPGSAD